MTDTVTSGFESSRIELQQRRVGSLFHELRLWAAMKKRHAMTKYCEHYTGSGLLYGPPSFSPTAIFQHSCHLSFTPADNQNA